MPEPPELADPPEPPLALGVLAGVLADVLAGATDGVGLSALDLDSLELLEGRCRATTHTSASSATAASAIWNGREICDIASPSAFAPEKLRGEICLGPAAHAG